MNNLTLNIKIPNEVYSLLEAIMRGVNALSKWLPDNINSDLVVLCVVLLGVIIAERTWLAMNPVDILNPVEIAVSELDRKRQPHTEDDDELRKRLVEQHGVNMTRGSSNQLNMYSSQWGGDRILTKRLQELMHLRYMEYCKYTLYGVSGVYWGNHPRRGWILLEVTARHDAKEACVNQDLILSVTRPSITSTFSAPTSVGPAK